MRPPSLIRLFVLVAALASPAHAGVAAPLSSALALAQKAPAFRESILSQIQVATSLSAQPAPTLTPLLSAPASRVDPWRGESGRLVAALAAQPQVLAAHQEQLRAVLGDHGVDLLRKTTARLQSGASAHPALRAQLDDLRRTFDLENASSDFGPRLDAIFENSRRAGESAVSVPDGPGRSPAVVLGRPGEAPEMSAEDLEAYVHKNAVTSPRGLKRVNFASGDYKPSYDRALRGLGVEMVVIKAPSRAEIGRFSEDDGYHLKTEYVRWVTPARTLEEHLALQPHNKARRTFQTMLRSSEGIRFELGPLTPEKFEQWYPLYESEVVDKPGGKRNVARDFARKLQAEGALSDRWGGFYYDPKDPTRMIGGMIMRAWREKAMLVGNFAAYTPELKDSSPAVRSFIEGLALARKLGLPVFSLGQDTNFYGYDYNIGLMANKAGLLVTPYPSEDVVLMKVLDTGKIASNRNRQGHSAGYFFFGIKRDSPLVERYLTSRESDPAPKDVDDLLGGLFFTPEILPAKGTIVGRYFAADDPNAPRTPHGIDVVRGKMAPPDER